MAGILFDPATLRARSRANLTPRMHVFHSLNLSLRGLDARGFRGVPLALAIAAALSYHVLPRRFARPALALLGALALVASPPFTYVSSSLMTHHHVAGLAFACATLPATMFGGGARASSVGAAEPAPAVLLRGQSAGCDACLSKPAR